MFSLGRAASVVGATVSALVMSTMSSAVGQSLQDCFDKAETHDGEPPTCTEVNGKWVASWPGGGGGAGGFAFLFILVALIGIGIVVWKVSTARRLASESGMDPGLATQMTLLTDAGLEATYLAANLRNPAPAPAATPAEQATTAKRLAELKGLLDEGLISQAEHDAQRRAIIDAV
ncbi:hypothetical protein [Aeromicrobium sp. 9AM]|uniref:hypothetical protein n=1 Tax=Aeromicrobium sp. 9AM TaxID=2653126 RepID=UPI0012F1D4A1|nr:hypothetical protein [Aeromicrobium sp. 9AM]VXB78705.1 conserved exported hypothetical protein [Aeromicrobium sp. 9AM]